MRPERGRVLVQGSSEKLLLALDPDRERAGEKYQAIRSKLVRLYQWRGCSPADSLADETIDRVARRLADGTRIRAADPARYFFGVARNVMKEHWARRRAEQAARQSWSRVSPLAGQPDGSDDGRFETLLENLDRCLARLPQESRALITVYYRSQKAEKVGERAHLARALNIAPGALRLRAHRIRRQLEAWVNEAMESKASS